MVSGGRSEGGRDERARGAVAAVVQGREVWSGVVGESAKLDLTRLTAGMHFIHLAGERPHRIILTD